MNNQIKGVIDNFRQSLTLLTKSHSHIDKALRRLFEALDKKGVRANITPDTLMTELTTSEKTVAENSQAVISLLEQSFELARMSALITSSLDLKQVINEVMDTVIHLTSAERAYLMLRDVTTGEMSIATARNWEREDLTSEGVVYSNAVIDLAIEKQTPIITANALEDIRFKSKKSVVVHALRSILCIPLVLRGETIGVLYADNPIQKSIFRNDDLPILNAFAQQTAIAIDNARLYREAEQANRQLHEANRLKSDFLGVISHELRSPFAPIGFAMQVFPRYGMAQLKPEQREAWDDLTKHIEQAQKLVNNLVNYAGLLSKQGALNLQAVNIAELIANAITDAGRMARTRNVTLATSVPAELMLPAGDYDRINEAVWHLLQNAIQYNKPGGQVIIRAEKDHENLYIQVEDTGIGIPEDQQERIWEAFEQGSDALKRGVEGLGLGLALVKYVAVAHGGHVTLESTPGTGSRFGLTIPLSPTQYAEAF